MQLYFPPLTADVWEVCIRRLKMSARQPLITCCFHSGENLEPSWIWVRVWVSPRLDTGTRPALKVHTPVQAVMLDRRLHCDVFLKCNGRMKKQFYLIAVAERWGPLWNLFVSFIRMTVCRTVWMWHELETCQAAVTSISVMETRRKKRNDESHWFSTIMTQHWSKALQELRKLVNQAVWDYVRGLVWGKFSALVWNCTLLAPHTQVCLVYLMNSIFWFHTGNWPNSFKQKHLVSVTVDKIFIDLKQRSKQSFETCLVFYAATARLTNYTSVSCSIGFQ